MANAPLKQPTNSFSFNKLTPSPPQVPEPYQPILTSSSRKFGKLKQCPPAQNLCLETFQTSYSYGWRVSRFATHIDKHCTTCGVIENDCHLFFLCNLSHQVWDHTTLPPFTHLIDPTQDGIQHILPHFLPLNTTDQTLTQILLLWYIWKARNDQCFQRKV
jgi:hypothetical protein